MVFNLRPHLISITRITYLKKVFFEWQQRNSILLKDGQEENKSAVSTPLNMTTLNDDEEEDIKIKKEIVDDVQIIGVINNANKKKKRVKKEKDKIKIERKITKRNEKKRKLEEKLSENTEKLQKIKKLNKINN